MMIDGSIESIHVRNFFCHDNLEIKFDKNVSIIVGRNGSGKSAILTALVVGLGGRASATNRGSNLSCFIKKGANSATIEIKIRNKSSRAYRHDVYGDYITIVRNITYSGTAYKVKSATGEVISTTYEEVNAIVLAHDIQVNNPISVLNQDDARSFYATDAKKKYNLFRRATNLDQTENNYKDTIEKCNCASVILKKKSDAFVNLKEEYKKWKTYYEQLQSQDENKKLEQALEDEYYWSEIVDLEREAAQIEAQYQRHKDDVEKQKQELQKMESSHENNSTNIHELKQQYEVKVKQKNELEKQLRLLEQEANEARASLRATQSNRNMELLNKENQKIEDLSRAIQDIQSGGAEAHRAELESRASVAHDAVCAARARYDTAQHEAEQARHARARALTHADTATKNIQRHKQTIGNLERQLRELESRGNDSLAVYGKYMPELCRQIRSKPEGYFSAPPKGPVGAYLKVKEKKWGVALEHIIGGSIRSFCVNTTEDSQKLFRIMGEVCGNESKPSVTCSRFLPRVHDVSRTKVSARNYISALDSLDVSDPVIANFLIDNIRMESILLVPDHDEAISLSDREENVPKNCSKIVTLDCTEFHPAPNYRSYGGDGGRNRFLEISSAERKKQLMAEIREKKNELRSIEAEAEEANREAQRTRQMEAEAAKALQALLIQLHDKEEKHRIAAAALEQRQAPQIDALVDDLNASKKKRDQLELLTKELAEKKVHYKQLVNELDVKMSDLNSKILSLTTNCNEIREEIDQVEMRQEQSLSERRTLEHRIRDKETKVGQVHEILAAKRTIIDKKIKSALKLCPRVNNPRPFADVKEELRKVKLKLSSMTWEGLTRPQVTEKYLAVRRKYEKVKQTIMSVQNLITDLHTTAEDHLRFCQSVQEEIIRRVQYTFQATLKIRGYSGRLDIDKGEGKVEIFAGRSASSTTTLSGGERTYATVAFIMALWECVELPFYFMDEFDVFMDKVNRKYVMDLLIDHAHDNTNRQFVFLTPQDTSSVKAGPNIGLFSMEDPRP